jgi:galactokinase/mevalonate kinase-like predicted kinase
VVNPGMLISRAPVRISFGGGGTDLPSFYERYGGLVVSTTISHYVYAIFTASSQEAVQIMSADYRTFWRQLPEDLIWDGDLALPRAILNEFDLSRGLEIFLASQVPPGTGLGSSGSVAVCLINGLATWQGMSLAPGEIAEKACNVEIDKMGMPVGRQDQYASAFGGLNFITLVIRSKKESKVISVSLSDCWPSRSWVWASNGPWRPETWMPSASCCTVHGCRSARWRQISPMIPSTRCMSWPGRKAQ